MIYRAQEQLNAARILKIFLGNGWKTYRYKALECRTPILSGSSVTHLHCSAFSKGQRNKSNGRKWISKKYRCLHLRWFIRKNKFWSKRESLYKISLLSIKRIRPDKFRLINRLINAFLGGRVSAVFYLIWK